MILQALTRHYEDLLKRGDIAVPGWSLIPISFALCLDADGELMQVIPTMEEKTQGKKTVLRPQEKTLPAAVKRSSDVAANFLWDNSTYLLGVDQKGKPERSRERFAAAAALHHAVLDGVDSPMARAILAFFDTWQPESAAAHPALQDLFDTATAGGNLVFWLDGCYPNEDGAVCDAWQRYYDGGKEDPVRMQCLVTGQADAIVAVHPSIKGVQGAQSSGAALVSFNAPAFCSYGHEQNYNAPVGKYAAFAYTAALNHLLADRDNVQRIGDTTVVCWAEGADPAYQNFAAILFGGVMPGLSDNDLRSALKHLANGLPCPDLGLDPARPFYVLGLAPNAARLSVRFFLRDTFGNLMRNVNDHYERLEIVRPSFAKSGVLPLWELLRETVNLNSKDKSPSPAMAGATARAVFSGGSYPASLLNAVLLRIRAEREITWGRAAILKAYLMRNIIGQRENDTVIKGVADVKLNENCAYMPYALGRLFSVMEQIQILSAGGKLNRSIKDGYFNAATTAPMQTFIKLFQLNEHHMKKLMRDDPKNGVYYSRLKNSILAQIEEPISVRFSQEETICFYLGYYHQTQKRYTKKEEKENG